MAYQNSAGNITIDEVAAMSDRNRIRQAIASLENAKRTVNMLAQNASAGQGKTCMAVVDKSNELIGEIDKMIARLNETDSYIARTVAHYEEIDADLKRIIESTIQNFG